MKKFKSFVFCVPFLLFPMICMGAGVTFHTSETNQKLGLPISDAARIGNVLYLSGQLGNLPGKPVLVEGGIGPETEQTLANIKSVLEAQGAEISDIASCTVYLVDTADRPVFGKIYRDFFKENYPARTTVFVKSLALNARIEITCLASVSG